MRAPAEVAVLPGRDEVETAWDRLALQSPQPDPFCATTHWQLSFREAIDPDRPLIVRHCSDGLIQFARHRLSDGDAFGPIERMWLFGANLLGPAAVELLEALLNDLKRETAGWRCPVVISGLTHDGARLAAIKSTFGESCALSKFRHEVQCAASLQGGVDGFLSRRSANLRRNLRRREKRAAMSDVRFERHSPASEGEAQAVFGRMLAVELNSWKGLGRCGMESPSMTRFYSIMLRRLSRSAAARVMFATHEGRDVGFIFGGLAGAIYRGQQFSFDESCRAMSIGNLLQFEQVKWLCEEGVERYDLGPLLGPSMEYKYHWTELRFPIEAWMLRAR